MRAAIGAAPLAAAPIAGRRRRAESSGAAWAVPLAASGLIASDARDARAGAVRSDAGAGDTAPLERIRLRLEAVAAGGGRTEHRVRAVAPETRAD